jgi:predicted transcriptional regulator
MPANVRIQPDTYAKLRALADEAGVTMPEVLDEAIDELYRKRFLDECNRAYGRLKGTSKAWKQELEERKAWEQTLDDGLEDA